MSHSGPDGHQHALTPEQRHVLLDNLARDCGWHSAAEMKAAVLDNRERNESEA